MTNFAFRTWETRVALGVMGVAAATLWWFGGDLSLKTQILLWGGLLGTVVLVAQSGWVNLFGPVLFYDLVRTGRRSRYILFRFIYGFILFGVLVWMHIAWNMEHRPQQTQQDRNTRAARLADQYFATFMTMQVLAVLLLTPAYTAGAIAEEKDRKTLEFILATDLEDREIVLSKLVSRLCSLTFVLLVSLPILSLMQFMGGVDPEMVLACYLATALTMTSLASLSILASVYARKTRDALGRVYMGTIAYLTVLPIVEILLRWVAPTVGAVRLWFGDGAPTILDVVEIVNHGNIFMAYWSLAMTVSAGRSLAAALENVLGDYVTFHVICTAICTTWAVLRLRAVALAQTSVAAVRVKAKSSLLPRIVRRRPPVSNRPMLWKEVYADSGPRLNILGRIVVGVLVLASFTPVGWIIYEYWFPSAGWGMNREQFHQAINVWVRLAGTIVGCLLLLSIAVRASGTITGERDKQTLDSLFTSPLESDTMFFAKWWGSICSVRWGLAWLGSIWLVGFWLGGLQFYAVPLVAGAWVVFACFFAALGMWFTTSSKTTTRATLMTMILALFFGGLNWLVLGMCCYAPLAWAGGRSNSGPIEEIMRFHGLGLTPPITLGWLALEGFEFDRTWQRRDAEKNTICAILGLCGWAVLAGCLYAAGNERFRDVSGRKTLRYGDYAPLRAPPEARGWG